MGEHSANHIEAGYKPALGGARISLRAPEKTMEQLRALAASGSSGSSRQAQAELRKRLHAQLAAELRGGRA